MYQWKNRQVTVSLNSNGSKNTQQHQLLADNGVCDIHFSSLRKIRSLQMETTIVQY
jgi:hypothetical protein